jgi:hypothetical protein
LDRLEAGEVPEAVSDLKNRTDEFSIPEDYFESGATSLGSSPRVVVQRKHAWLVYTGVAGLLAAVAILSAIVAQNVQGGEAGSVRKSKAKPELSAESATINDTSAASNRPPERSIEETTVRQVVLATEPLDALVYLDGKNIGSSPVVVDVVDGQKAKLEIRRSGYRSKEVTIDGTEGRLSVRLEKAGSVRSAPRATGGKPKGATPTDLGDPWAKR